MNAELVKFNVFILLLQLKLNIVIYISLFLNLLESFQILGYISLINKKKSVSILNII